MTQLVLGDSPVSCPSCGDPVDVGENFCGICGDDLRHLQPAVDGPGRQQVSCEGCGATMTVEDQGSLVCPFCKSVHVVATAGAEAGHAPEFVVGFASSEEVARGRFREWVRKGGITVPGDLGRASTLSEIHGVYVPFWGFSVRADSRYRARIGEYWYRTETYTVMVNGKLQTRTRTVRETEWFSLDGHHHSYHNRYLVSGSKGLPQALADAVMPYDLARLHRFKESFLAGWTAETPSVEPDEAYEISNQRFYEEEKKRVAALLPGDTHRDLSVQTTFSQATRDLLLLPMWLLVYDYKGERYRFVMNGQTGAMSGTRPKTWWKVVLLVLGILGLLAACGGGLALVLAVLGAFA